MNGSSTPRVKLFGTGGTIASLGQGPLDFTDYGVTKQKISVQEHLDRLPDVKGVVEIEAEQVLSVGSPLIGPPEWVTLAGRINQAFDADPGLAGIALTHGTNTMEETAYFLNLTVKSDRPVVMTGAMRPASAISTDADINLLDSVRLAASPDARNKGVMVVLNNEIIAAREVTKTNTYRVDTFSGGPMGILGYMDSDGKSVFYQTPTRKHTYQTEFSVPQDTPIPRVDIVYAYAGGDGVQVRAAVAAGAKGIISAGSGAGGGAPDYNTALEEASAQGIPVVQASHVGSGRVVMTQRRKEHGFIVSDNLSPKKSRILLMLGLMVTDDKSHLQEMFFSY
jgi:L-asparaginase